MAHGVRRQLGLERMYSTGSLAIQCMRVGHGVSTDRDRGRWPVVTVQCMHSCALSGVALVLTCLRQQHPGLLSGFVMVCPPTVLRLTGGDADRTAVCIPIVGPQDDLCARQPFPNPLSVCCCALLD